MIPPLTLALSPNFEVVGLDTHVLPGGEFSLN